MIHGYDYKFVQAPEYTDRHQTWVKVPMIREALKTYDYVVFMDADAVFTHHHLPLEWLFNHWNITSETLIAMALDPSTEFNKDERGNVNLNTGFIIAQASKRTTEVFNIWEDCVTEDRFANCSKWRYEWSHEQAAFSNYLRYEYSGESEVIQLPCAEANGYPSRAELGCTGEFVRHFWQDKGQTVSALQDAVTQYTTLRLHEQFHDQLEHTLVNATDTTLPLKAGEQVVV
jgi:galactosyl transferase GMA12/MNN10 family